eukprot:TRINITY_DN13693_c0_g1_i2.p1 TRINITY_DN13693_c0_g1~~TRINITY_DN13693_c0_g1_i2.p1  ORF type:complete len:323 (-),score=13.03 TRINITY_DN13693_c0_g1_i2:159-1127(-)
MHAHRILRLPIFRGCIIPIRCFSLKSGNTVREIIQTTTEELRRHGVDRPRHNAAKLLDHAIHECGLDMLVSSRTSDRLLSAAVIHSMKTLVDRRGPNREPLDYITGSKEFWSLDFKVSQHTLVPRPDTETCVDAARDMNRTVGPFRNILDVGTGSGCILLSLLNEFPRAKGLGLDVSEDALSIARSNALQLNLAQRAHFVYSDWLGYFSSLPVSERIEYDLIVSNPPYIPEAEIEGLQPEVARWEPRLALSGGKDGLDAYRSLSQQLSRIPVLAHGGVLIVEVGHDQARAVSDIVTKNLSIQHVDTRLDLQGIQRCLIFRRT